LDRTQPLLPIDFDRTEKRTHDYKRHGTTNLFAALDVATGQVIPDCYPRRTGEAFLAFLKKAVKPHAGKQIHVVLDNLSTHTTPDVQAWLARNRHVHFHFTPAGSSWMNQIENWFQIITKQAIHPRQLRLSRRTDPPHPRLHRALEHRRPTVRLDRHRRRDPGQGPLGRNQRQATRREQH
jgi:transposase